MLIIHIIIYKGMCMEGVRRTSKDCLEALLKYIICNITMYFGSAFNIHSYITYYVLQKCFQYTYLYYTLCILEAPNMELFVLICTVGTSLWLHVHSSVTRSRLIVTLECNKELDFSSLLHSVHMEAEVCSDCVNVL